MMFPARLLLMLPMPMDQPVFVVGVMEGPIYAVAGKIFLPGSTVGRVFQPGSVAGKVFKPGSEAGTVRP